MRHRFDCASCVSSVDPMGEHPRIGWPHSCYVCGKRRWWPTHWLWRWKLVHMAREIGFDPDHPLVRCPGCGAEYTACELGNHYCPSCGDSCEGASPVGEVHVIAEELDEHRRRWQDTAHANGWWTDYVQVWVDQDGHVRDSVAVGGMTQDIVVLWIDDEGGEG